MRYVIQHRASDAREWNTLPGTFPSRIAADRHMTDLGGRECLDPTGFYRVVLERDAAS